MPSFKNIFKVVGSEQAVDQPPPGAGDVMERIGKDIEANPVLVFMKGDRDMPQCGFSAATIEAISSLGVPFETRDVLQDPDLRQGIKEFSNWPTIPQVYIGGKFIGGCDIVLEMHKQGQLQPIVDSALKG